MRQHLVTVVAAAIAATSVSFALAEATGPPATSSADRAVVRELRLIKAQVRKLRTEGERGWREAGLMAENVRWSRSQLHATCLLLREPGGQLCPTSVGDPGPAFP